MRTAVWVREVVAWHFDPATGAPFWLDFAKRAGWDPRKEVRGYADLDRFGNVSQPVGAERAKPETVGRNRVVGEVSGDAADQHLVAVGEVEEAPPTRARSRAPSPPPQCAPSRQSSLP